MKANAVISLSFVALLVSACKNGSVKEEMAKKFPRPGALIAQATMPVTGDPLNHFDFSVKIIADSNVRSGVYDVLVDFGPNNAAGQMTMPKGGEYLTPVIRKSSAPYTYIIGFKVAGDTTFYDYFEVSSDKHTTKMKYLNYYSF